MGDSNFVSLAPWPAPRALEGMTESREKELEKYHSAFILGFIVMNYFMPLMTIGFTRREQDLEIYDAIRFGFILENVGFDHPVFDSLTVNNRVAYPLKFILVSTVTNSLQRRIEHDKAGDTFIRQIEILWALKVFSEAGETFIRQIEFLGALTDFSKSEGLM